MQTEEPRRPEAFRFTSKLSLSPSCPTHIVSSSSLASSSSSSPSLALPRSPSIPPYSPSSLTVPPRLSSVSFHSSSSPCLTPTHVMLGSSATPFHPSPTTPLHLPLSNDARTNAELQKQLSRLSTKMHQAQAQSNSLSISTSSSSTALNHPFLSEQKHGTAELMNGSSPSLSTSPLKRNGHNEHTHVRASPSFGAASAASTVHQMIVIDSSDSDDAEMSAVVQPSPQSSINGKHASPSKLFSVEQVPSASSQVVSMPSLEQVNRTILPFPLVQSQVIVTNNTSDFPPILTSSLAASPVVAVSSKVIDPGADLLHQKALLYTQNRYEIDEKLTQAERESLHRRRMSRLRCTWRKKRKTTGVWPWDAQDADGQKVRDYIEGSLPKRPAYSAPGHSMKADGQPADNKKVESQSKVSSTKALKNGAKRVHKKLKDKKSMIKGSTNKVAINSSTVRNNEQIKDGNMKTNDIPTNEATCTHPNPRDEKTNIEKPNVEIQGKRLPARNRRAIDHLRATSSFSQMEEEKSSKMPLQVFTNNREPEEEITPFSSSLSSPLSSPILSPLLSSSAKNKRPSEGMVTNYSAMDSGQRSKVLARVGYVLKRRVMGKPVHQWTCAICEIGTSFEYGLLLRCSGPCGFAYHQRCVEMRLVPAGAWWCSSDCFKKATEDEIVASQVARRWIMRHARRDKQAANHGGERNRVIYDSHSHRPHDNCWVMERFRVGQSNEQPSSSCEWSAAFAALYGDKNTSTDASRCLPVSNSSYVLLSLVPLEYRPIGNTRARLLSVLPLTGSNSSHSSVSSQLFSPSKRGTSRSSSPVTSRHSDFSSSSDQFGTKANDAGDFDSLHLSARTGKGPEGSVLQHRSIVTGASALLHRTGAYILTLRATENEFHQSVCCVCEEGESLAGNELVLCAGPCAMVYHHRCASDSTVTLVHERDEWFCGEACKQAVVHNYTLSDALVVEHIQKLRVLFVQRESGLGRNSLNRTRQARVQEFYTMIDRDYFCPHEMLRMWKKGEWRQTSSSFESNIQLAALLLAMSCKGADECIPQDMNQRQQPQQQQQPQPPPPPQQQQPQQVNVVMNSTSDAAIELKPTAFSSEQHSLLVTSGCSFSEDSMSDIVSGRPFASGLSNSVQSADDTQIASPSLSVCAGLTAACSSSTMNHVHTISADVGWPICARQSSTDSMPLLPELDTGLDELDQLLAAYSLQMAVNNVTKAQLLNTLVQHVHDKRYSFTGQPSLDYVSKEYVIRTSFEHEEKMQVGDSVERARRQRLKLAPECYCPACCDPNQDNETWRQQLSCINEELENWSRTLTHPMRDSTLMLDTDDLSSQLTSLVLPAASKPLEGTFDIDSVLKSLAGVQDYLQHIAVFREIQKQRTLQTQAAQQTQARTQSQAQLMSQTPRRSLNTRQRTLVNSTTTVSHAATRSRTSRVCTLSPASCSPSPIDNPPNHSLKSLVHPASSTPVQIIHLTTRTPTHSPKRMSFSRETVDPLLGDGVFDEPFHVFASALDHSWYNHTSTFPVGPFGPPAFPLRQHQLYNTAARTIHVLMYCDGEPVFHPARECQVKFASRKKEPMVETESRGGRILRSSKELSSNWHELTEDSCTNSSSLLHKKEMSPALREKRKQREKLRMQKDCVRRAKKHNLLQRARERWSDRKTAMNVKIIVDSEGHCSMEWSFLHLKSNKSGKSSLEVRSLQQDFAGAALLNIADSARHLRNRAVEVAPKVSSSNEHEMPAPTVTHIPVSHFRVEELTLRGVVNSKLEAPITTNNVQALSQQPLQARKRGRPPSKRAVVIVDNSTKDAANVATADKVTSSTPKLAPTTSASARRTTRSTSEAMQAVETYRVKRKYVRKNAPESLEPARRRKSPRLSK